jgi:nitrite reductase/ring-hydroxylating ferredoxin subunit
MPMIKLFPVNELPENSKKVVQVGKSNVLVIHTQGKFFAVDNHCPHMSFPLNRGKVTDDCAIICAFHHSAFDLVSGDVKDWAPWPPLVGKAMGALVREKALPVFMTEVKDGALWVSSEPKA